MQKLIAISCLMAWLHDPVDLPWTFPNTAIVRDAGYWMLDAGYWIQGVFWCFQECSTVGSQICCLFVHFRVQNSSGLNLAPIHRSKKSFKKLQIICQIWKVCPDFVTNDSRLYLILQKLGNTYQIWQMIWSFLKDFFERWIGAFLCTAHLAWPRESSYILTSPAAGSKHSLNPVSSIPVNCSIWEGSGKVYWIV